MGKGSMRRRSGRWRKMVIGRQFSGEQPRHLKLGRMGKRSSRQ
jgi:hypothetical protein